MKFRGLRALFGFVSKKRVGMAVNKRKQFVSGSLLLIAATSLITIQQVRLEAQDRTREQQPYGMLRSENSNGNLLKEGPPLAPQGNGGPSPSCGPPDYKCSYNGTDPKPLCTECAVPKVPDMSARPNAVTYDHLFGISVGNQIVRCTYPEMNERNNRMYMIGSGGSGDSHVVGIAGGSPPSYRLMIGDAGGSSYPFTYVPDPVHPTCEPTYRPMSSFAVYDGAFSWKVPHLYYEFQPFKVMSLDLGGPKPPKAVRVVDFQQVLPRDGSDWPGPGQAVPLGTIIRPRAHNSGKYLYQASCPGRQPDCRAGTTGTSAPVFTQSIMTNTNDGTVKWRNIGAGFNGSPSWSAIGGVSTDDDVFVRGFSDAGGQGGVGAIFVAAYKRSTNTYYLYNVGTGVISYSTCTGGTGDRCSGGSWKQTIVGTTKMPDRFLLHNVKVNKSGEWVVIALDECRFNTCSLIPGSIGPYLWKLSTTEIIVNKITTHPYGHWTEGFDLFANQDGDPGVKFSGRTFAKPEDQFALNNAPPRQGIDTHPSWNYNDGSDSTPICTATAGSDWPYKVAEENEVICFGTNADSNCASSGHPLCRNVVKRFFHTYNPGTCDQGEGFSGCWGIGALFQDGKYYAFTSSWGDTLGSVSRGGSGPGSCRGGFDFQPNYSYNLGDAFEPSNGGHQLWNGRFTVYKVTVAGRAQAYPGAWPTGWNLRHQRQGFYRNGEKILPRAGNPCNHLFKVTAGGGTANGSTVPDWKKAYGYQGSCSSVKAGGQVKDGGITWTDKGEFVIGTLHLANMGRDDCRSDVFIGTLN